MQKRNIIHVTNSNALSLYLISIAKLYNKDRYNLTIGCFDKAGPLHEALNKMNIPTFHIDLTKNYQYVFKCFRLYQILKKNKTDILHLHTFFPSFFGLMMGRLAGVKKIVITRHHADFHIIKNKKIHSFIDSYTARHCDVVIAVSQWTKKIMVEREHVDSNKIHVILNGIMPLEHDPLRNKAWICNEFKIPNDTLIITCIARLFPEKNLEVVLSLISVLKKNNQKVILFVCGDGLNNAYHQKLMSLCKRENIQNDVRFTGFRNDVGDILRNSNLFIHPSLGESFGFAILEAMSIGVPIIASNIPSVYEIAGPEVAYIFDPLSAEDLYSKFAQWQQDGDGALLRIRKGVERYKNNFTFETMISQYEALYES